MNPAEWKAELKRTGTLVGMPPRPLEGDPAQPQMEPRVRTPNVIRSKPDHTTGPGTELKKLLGRLGILALGKCACNQRAAIMDAWGPERCRNEIETIAGWLKQEADQRRLPFSKIAAKMVIKLAIRRAEKLLSS